MNGQPAPASPVMTHGVRRYLLPDLPGQFPGLAFVAGRDDHELPAPRDHPALSSSSARWPKAATALFPIPWLLAARADKIAR
jgi:hypothetical protein